MKTFYDLIGESDKDLTSMQMGIRAFLVFIIALILIRISGRRAFGMHSPFDIVTSILLGAILSRSVIGGCPFFAPIAGSFVIVTLHWIISWINTHNDKFGMLVKGKAKLLYEDGKILQKNMVSGFISRKDLEEAMRKENVDSLEKVKTAHMERDGTISIVKK